MRTTAQLVVALDEATLDDPEDGGYSLIDGESLAPGGACEQACLFKYVLRCVAKKNGDHQLASIYGDLVSVIQLRHVLEHEISDGVTAQSRCVRHSSALHRKL